MLRLPANTPFLDALCWHGERPRDLPLNEILSLYERGWRFLGILATPSPEEKDFIRNLSQRYNSWLQTAA